jgi:nucleotide-binding universal stress UspA family protein
MNNVVLITTNGFEGTWPAIEYGAWTASAIEAEVVLLGILEDAGEEYASRKRTLDSMIGRATALFEEQGLEYSVERRQGRSEDIIAREAPRIGGLTVLGPLGRPLLRRLILGRSIRSLLEDIPTPVLYIPRACLPPKKILICIGGLGYEVTAEHLAVRLGASAGAEATLLHVAPHVDLDYPTARAEREHWQDLAETDTLPGRNLRRALETAREAGLSASIKARQGNVVEEILEEIKDEGYDLICMGSAHGVNGLRQLYGPNVTDEVAEHAHCPVLTARYAPEAEPADG